MKLHNRTAKDNPFRPAITKCYRSSRSVSAVLGRFSLRVLKELYSILFKSHTAWDNSKDKIRAAHKGSINSGYFGSNAHGEVDLPWLKEETKK